MIDESQTPVKEKAGPEIQLTKPPRQLIHPNIMRHRNHEILNLQFVPAEGHLGIDFVFQARVQGGRENPADQALVPVRNKP